MRERAKRDRKSIKKRVRRKHRKKERDRNSEELLRTDKYCVESKFGDRGCSREKRGEFGSEEANTPRKIPRSMKP